MSRKRLLSALSSSRWWGLIAAALVFLMLSGTAILCFRASMGCLAWLTTEQIWIRNRQRAVNCLRHAIEHQDATELDRCEDAFVSLHRFDKLKQHVEAKEFSDAYDTVSALGLQENEAEAASDLFEIAHNLPLVGSAYEVWGAAIHESNELAALAQNFREAHRAAPISAERRTSYLQQLDQIDGQLQVHEERFGWRSIAWPRSAPSPLVSATRSTIR